VAPLNLLESFVELGVANSRDVLDVRKQLAVEATRVLVLEYLEDDTSGVDCSCPHHSLVVLRNLQEFA
jgi:hypothetical protein